MMSSIGITTEILQQKIAHFSDKLMRGELDMPSLLSIQQYAASVVGSGLTIADARAKHLLLVYCDTAFLTLTGYRLPEVIGQNCSFLQGEQTNDETVAMLRGNLYRAKPEPMHVVILNYRKDGSRFWNNLYIEPVFDKEGDTSHFIGVQKDITQQMRYSKEVVKSAQELARLHIKIKELEATVAMLSKGHNDGIRKAVRKFLLGYGVMCFVLYCFVSYLGRATIY